MTDGITTAVAGIDMSEPAAPAAEAPAQEVEDSGDDPFLAFENNSADADDEGFGTEASPTDDVPVAEEAPEPAQDTKKYEVESADGTKKKMTVGEMQKALKASGMFQADHTRKTQELAEGRKTLSREAVAFKAERAKFNESMSSAREFFQSISKKDADPYYVMRMLQGQGVPIREAVNRLVNDVLHERSLPDEERAQRDRVRRNRAALAEEKYHEERVSKARKAADEQRRSVETATQIKRLNNWSTKAIADAGLPNDAYTTDRLRSALREIAAKEKRMLTYDDFKEAAVAAKKSLISPLSSFSEDDLVNDLDEARARQLALALQKRLKQKPAAQQASAPARAPRPQTQQSQPNGYKRPTLADRLRGG